MENCWEFFYNPDQFNSWHIIWLSRHYSDIFFLVPGRFFKNDFAFEKIIFHSRKWLIRSSHFGRVWQMWTGYVTREITRETFFFLRYFHLSPTSISLLFYFSPIRPIWSNWLFVIRFSLTTKSQFYAVMMIQYFSPVQANQFGRTHTQSTSLKSICPRINAFNCPHHKATHHSRKYSGFNVCRAFE